MTTAFPSIAQTRRTARIIPALEGLVESGIISAEEAADAVLESANALGRARGAFTTHQLARRARLDVERLPILREDDIPCEVVDEIVEQRVDELVALAGLSPMQEICFRLCVDGLSTRQSAIRLGIGRRRVQMHLRAARHRVQAVYDEGPYAGWYEVYLSEVRRGRKA